MGFFSGIFRGGRPDWAKTAVFLLTTAFFINFSNRAALGPFLVHMRVDLGLDPAQAASLLSLVSIGMGCGMLCSGLLTSILAPRRIISFSLVGAGASLLLIARSGGLVEVRLLFMLIGLVSGLYLTSAMATLATLVRPESWSRAVAVHELAPSVSVIVSPVLAETASALLGWRGGMALMGSVSITAGVLFLCWKNGGMRKLERPSMAGALDAFHKPVFWVFIWLFALCVGGEFGPYSVLPLSLTSEQGLNSAEAAKLLSLSRFPTPFLVLVGGYAVSRWSARKCLLLFLAVHGLSLVGMFLPYDVIGKAGLCSAMAGQAMAASFAFPALFTLFAESFPREKQPMLLSLSVPVASFLGGGLTPYLLGVSGKYLTFGAGYCFFGLICLASIVLLRLCRE